MRPGFILSLSTVFISCTLPAAAATLNFYAQLGYPAAEASFSSCGVMASQRGREDGFLLELEAFNRNAGAQRDRDDDSLKKQEINIPNPDCLMS